MYDIVGEMDIVGATPGPMPWLKDAVRPMVAPYLPGAGGMYVPLPGSGPGRQVMQEGLAGKTLRRQALGFGSQLIAAGGTVTFTASPQRPMRIEKLVIAASAVGLVVTAINVGADPQLVNTGAGVPVELFQNNTLGNELRASTAQIGHQVTVVINNPTAGNITASIGAIGEALD